MGPDSDPFDRDIDEDDEFEDHQSMYDEDESGRTGKEVDDTEQLSEVGIIQLGILYYFHRFSKIVII